MDRELVIRTSLVDLNRQPPALGPTLGLRLQTPSNNRSCSTGQKTLRYCPTFSGPWDPFSGAAVRPNMLNTPKSVSKMFLNRMRATDRFSM